MFRPFPPECISLAAFLSVVAAATATPPQRLIKDSPFIPTAISALAPANVSALELHGVLKNELGPYMFNIVEVGSHHSQWVQLDEADGLFTVRSYDERSERVTVEYRGEILSLSLRQRKVGADAPKIVFADEINRMSEQVTELRLRNELIQEASPTFGPANQRSYPRP